MDPQLNTVLEDESSADDGFVLQNSASYKKQLARKLREALQLSNSESKSRRVDICLAAGADPHQYKGGTIFATICYAGANAIKVLVRPGLSLTRSPGPRANCGYLGP
jgi:hypothetical protein